VNKSERNKESEYLKHQYTDDRAGNVLSKITEHGI
jgi:hypothetical protein